MNSPKTVTKSTCALSLAIALAAAAAPALAKGAARPAQEKKAAVAEASASSRTIVGTLSDYKPGHTLAVMKADHSVEPFDLEDKEVTFNVAPELKKGADVVVTESVQPDGKRVVTIVAKK
jgi:hypothetical protein